MVLTANVTEQRHVLARVGIQVNRDNKQSSLEAVCEHAQLQLATDEIATRDLLHVFISHACFSFKQLLPVSLGFLAERIIHDAGAT